MTHRTWTSIGAGLIALGTIFGAMGAHVLRGAVTPESYDVYHTAIFYNVMNGFGIIVVTITRALGFITEKHHSAVAGLLTAGVIIFSGSLYASTITGGAFVFYLITPIGGLALIGGWMLFFYSLLSPLEPEQDSTKK